jgi:hypothetical protein
MAHKGRRRNRTRLGRKWLVSRHGNADKAGAAACERAIEKVERRDARREIAEQLDDRGA